MKAPKLIVIAGPNGAGKSTLARRYVKGRLPFVNADDIAEHLRGTTTDGADRQIRAARNALEARRAHIAARRSFVVETTLSGRGPLSLIRDAKLAGYRVWLAFVGLRDSTLSVLRVRQRVLIGGHDVPVDAVLRRYGRSLSSLPEALAMADRAWVFDNSNKRRLIIMKRNGRVRAAAGAVPGWVDSVLGTVVPDDQISSEQARR